MSESISPEVLIARLGADHEAWRIDAELRLIALGPVAVEPLLAALDHGMVSVRLHAIRALSQLRDGRALGPIAAALADAENHGAVAIAAERALVAWGPESIASVLRAALVGVPAARPRAVRALGRLGGPEVLTALRSLLCDREPAVRAQAAVALLANAVPASEVLHLLEDRDPYVRLEIAEALVGIGAVEGGPTLKALAQEFAEQPEVVARIEGLLAELQQMEGG